MQPSETVGPTVCLFTFGVFLVTEFKSFIKQECKVAGSGKGKE